MGRELGKLSALLVRKTKTVGMHADGGGLYLNVRHRSKQTTKRGDKPQLTKTWVYRFMLNRRAREMGLGSVDLVTLEEARERARAARQLRASGIDPLDHRETTRDAAKLAAQLEAAKSKTFAQCAADCIKDRRAGWRNAKHAAQWPATLKTYAEPILGHLPIQSIDTNLLHQVLAPIWTTKPETARRVRSRIEAVLDWSKARNYREGENPARWRGHLKELLPRHQKKSLRVKHHPALAYEEIGAFMVDLRSRNGTVARALEFLILTAARTGEVFGAKWPEISTAQRLWIIPADRIKGAKEHRVPLTDRALGIIEEMAKNKDDYLFPGTRRGKQLAKMSLLNLLKQMGREDLTVHGFRSTLRDWAAEQTAFPREIAEKALAHSVADETERAYQRGDLLKKREQLMQAWARYCAVAKPKKTAEVVSIAR